MRLLIPRVDRTLQTLTPEYEILVIDDGSSASTLEVLDSLAQEYPSLRVVRHARNLGYGAALRSGFQNATKDLVFYTDGDGQYDVEELCRLMALLSPDVDVVVGYKTTRADTRSRAIAGYLYRALANLLFRLKLKDVDCDFRLMRKKVIAAVPLTCSSGAICIELMRQIQTKGFRIAQVPVTHLPRLHGRSQFFRVGPVAKTLQDLFRLWIRLVLSKPSAVSDGPSLGAHGVE